MFMKRFFSLLLACLLALPMAGCGGSEAVDNGTYHIEVESSSSMFRVVDCLLTVDDGAMTATMTMSGDGYGFVYLGTGEQAAADSESAYIPFVLDGQGAKTFTIPVSALDTEIDCAAWSIRKERWYDRTLVFRSESLAPAAERSDGTYTVEVSLSGGSGRASVQSPAALVIEGDSMTATIVWSSPYYEYMLVDGVRYEPIQEDGNSTFEIPVVLDTDLAVSASTIAMSEPHLVDYTLRLDSASLQEA